VVQNNAQVKLGESVLVYGAVGVGLNIIQAASLVGGYPVIAVGLYDGRLDLAKKMGATHLINSNKVDAKLEVLKIVGDRGVDVFIDNTGLPDIIELGYAITNPQGKLTLVGVPRMEKNINIYSLPLHFGKVLSGSHGGEANPSSDIPRYLNLFNSNRIKLKEIVTEILPLTSINDAIENIKSGKINGRCLIKM